MFHQSFDPPEQALTSPARLETILAHLKDTIGGFVDLGILDAAGQILAHVGPHPFEKPRPGKNPCFDHVVAQGFFCE